MPQAAIAKAEEMIVAESNKIALVTGAGTGVGQAVTLGLVAAGFTVVLSGRRQEPLDATAAKAGQDRTFAVTADVGDPASVRAISAP